MLNMQYIGILIVATIITTLFYFNDQPAEQQNIQVIKTDYTKYGIIWIVCCSIGFGGLYFYTNGLPENLSQLGSSIVEKNITSNITKVSENIAGNKDPSVIASLPDF